MAQVQIGAEEARYDTESPGGLDRQFGRPRKQLDHVIRLGHLPHHWFLLRTTIIISDFRW